MDARELQRRAIALLDLLLDLDAEGRRRVLDVECGGHPELRALVESLLAADQADHDLLGAASGGLSDGLGQVPERLRRVGPYRLLAELGRGGMATVYLAEREVGGARQRVALKLLRRGMTLGGGN